MGIISIDEDEGTAVDYPLAEKCVFKLMEEETVEHKEVPFDTFKEVIQSRQEKQENDRHFYDFAVENGEVQEVSECYIP